MGGWLAVTRSSLSPRIGFEAGQAAIGRVAAHQSRCLTSAYHHICCPAGRAAARQQPQELQELAAKLAQAEQAAEALLRDLAAAAPVGQLLPGLQLNFPTSLLQQLLVAAQGDDAKQGEQQQQGSFLADVAAEELRERLVGLAKQVVELQVQLAHKDAQFQKLLQVGGGGHSGTDGSES